MPSIRGGSEVGRNTGHSRKCKDCEESKEHGMR